MPTKNYAAFRLDEDMDKLIRDYAEKHDLTISQVIRRAMRVFFANARNVNKENEESDNGVSNAS